MAKMAAVSGPSKLPGKRWINSDLNKVYVLCSVSTFRGISTANWRRLTIGSYFVSAAGLATLSGGTITVTNANCYSTSIVIATIVNESGTIAPTGVTAINNGNFVITSFNSGDSSTYGYIIINSDIGD